MVPTSHAGRHQGSQARVLLCQMVKWFSPLYFLTNALSFAGPSCERYCWRAPTFVGWDLGNLAKICSKSLIEGTWSTRKLISAWWKSCQVGFCPVFKMTLLHGHLDARVTIWASTELAYKIWATSQSSLYIKGILFQCVDTHELFHVSTHGELRICRMGCGYPLHSLYSLYVETEKR